MSGSDGGRARLEEHVRGCAECEREPPAIAAIDTALTLARGTIDPGAMSVRVLAEACPRLQRRAAALYRRRVSVTLGLALVPLPVMLAYGSYVLRSIHGLLAQLLPEVLATYLVSGYAATLVLLLATTYAAIPVVIDRMGPQRAIT